jgi:oxygen-independent coproporphyrinogen-3 oxidase
MILALDLQPPELYKQLHELIRLSFPDYEIQLSCLDSADINMEIRRSESGDRVFFTASLKTEQLLTKDSQEYQLDSDESLRSKQLARFARIFIYHLLCQHTGKNINPYGILTGVRPLKLVHQWLDQGNSIKQVLARLENDYLVEAGKARRLADVALNNRPYLHSRQEARRKISLYIGIPFCPSRCYYCSFPGAILNNYELEIEPFLAALKREIEGLGECIKQLHLEVENIYWGGGTPSILKEDDLESLFQLLKEQYISAATGEITVEAGRPDTLSRDKLQLLKGLGVNRVCINPQTMQAATLKRIGRHHSLDDIYNAVQWVRDAGIENLNMDMIIGLPGEGLAEYKSSTQQILALRPENITVHSLAVKKGSRLDGMEGKSQLGYRVGEVKAGIQHIDEILTENAYLPYYLYRQKYMKANVENTGYSLADHFCNYNIQVMEERQTIIGLGGAASSKFVNAADWHLTHLHNPKEPNAYCQRLTDLLARKVDKLKALN